jgi:surface protein
VVTLDRDNSNGLLMYVDGIKQTDFEDPTPLSAVNIASGDTFAIGSRETYSSYNFDYKGDIDEPMVLFRALTDAEINQLYMTNLYKYDTDKWALHVNQSLNSTDGLTDGTYTYFASVNDGANQENMTEVRTVTIEDPTTIFISVWNTSAISYLSFNETTISLPLVENGGDYDFTVDWGDGNTTTVTEWDSSNATHDYGVENEGVYTINITGKIQGFRFANGGDKLKIIDIKQWGPLNVGNLNGYFYGCSNLDVSATDVLNLTGTTDMNRMFGDATNFNGNISNWDVSNVLDMERMFMGASNFNQSLNNWNVSKVTRMDGMFALATNFNQNLSNWDVSNVTTMNRMFRDADNFNQNLSNWDVSNVTTMNRMFFNADDFNGNISNWNVSSVRFMKGMFEDATSFNGNISNWDVSNVTDMNSMFEDAANFNGNISNWDVSNVTDMNSMFEDATSFNQSLNNWNVSNVTNMNSMFAFATSFNQNLSNWDVSNVTTMSWMFASAYDFNQNLSNWNVSNV